MESSFAESPGLYPVLPGGIGESDENAAGVGVAVSSRHVFDEGKVRIEPVAINSHHALGLLSLGDADDVTTAWRWATAAAGSDTASELQARRIENLTWRVQNMSEEQRAAADVPMQSILNGSGLPRSMSRTDLAAMDTTAKSEYWNMSIAKARPDGGVGGGGDSADDIQEWAIAVHGGAGTITDMTSIPARLKAFNKILSAGTSMLEAGATATDTAVHVVALLEDCEYFNAGRGSVLTSMATFEMDAGFMDGQTLTGGGVAGASRVKNPIKLAKIVAEETPHVLIVGPGKTR